jgi:hypothetical protein
MPIELPEFEQIIEYATSFYYTKFILWISVLYTIITIKKKQLLSSEYRPLVIYLVLELTLGLIDNLISPNRNISLQARLYFINFSNIIIAIFEFNFFSSLHNRVFNYKKNNINKVLFLVLSTLSALIIFYTSFIDALEMLRLTYLLGSLEFLLIIYPSVDYFKSLIHEMPKISLFEKGSFWCFLGALFYCSVSAPFYVVGPHFPTGNEIFDSLLPALLYYMPFSILFFCLSKGLTCKTPIWN